MQQARSSSEPRQDRATGLCYHHRVSIAQIVDRHAAEASGLAKNLKPA
jgi:hypothetical protein